MAQTTKREHLAEKRRERESVARAAVRKKQRIRTLVTVGGGILGVGLLILVGALILAHRQSNTPLLGTPVAEEGRTHVPDGSPLTFKHYPPSSGSHYPAPAAAGYYPTPVPEGSFVHSLEHGYIVILYKPSAVGAPGVEQLKGYIQTFPKTKYGNVKLVITPYDHMDSPVTALAWDRELPLSGVDQQQLLAFYQADVNHGPEDVP